ncbi:MAG: DVUA0089 family protein, partial [Rubrivivax sp.]|nr:DVUA0089 family protein [Rubrivivax sp.]
ADPSLFLFDGSGNGIFWNNDASLAPVDTQSAFGTDLAIGSYFIALSWFGMDAEDGSGPIFDTAFSNEGGALPGTGALANWADYSGQDLWDRTAYNINISMRVPEPGALALSLAALGLMAGAMRRRQSVAA